MFFSSAKGINRLISKGMSNIFYLKVTIEKNRRSKNFDFISLNFFSPVVFGELQLTQLSLNFKTSCCNIKIRGLGAKVYVAFKVKDFMHFVEQKQKYKI